MRTLLPMLALLTLAACVEDVGKGKVKADVQDVPTQTEAQTDAADAKAEADAVDAVTLKIDKSGSNIRALGAKITATHPIDFKTFDGEIKVKDEALQSVNFTVDMASLESDHPKLTAHLKDKDFFFIEQYPKAMFKSTEIKAGSTEEGDWTHTVTGDFTIRGKTKRVSFPAKVMVEGGKVKANAEFVIDRKDFGVVYPGKPDDLVQDNVRMTINIASADA